MAISVQCVKCDRTLKVKPEFAGRTVRCPGCQSPLKVPAAEDEFEFGDLPAADQNVEERRLSKPQRRSSSNDPSILQRVAPYWYLGTPVISGIVGLLSPMFGAGIGLLILAAGVLLAAYGFLSAFSVDPIYFLSPFARMARSDAERKRIGKQMAPYFRSFGKGLLITALGCLSVWLSFELVGRGHKQAAKSQMAESREREDQRIAPGGSTASQFPPGLPSRTGPLPAGAPPTAPVGTVPGTPPPAMPTTPAGTESPASPTPDAAPFQPIPGPPPVVPSPPVATTRPETPRVPRERLVPNAVMFAWVNGGWRPVILQKVISDDRVSAIVPVFSADGMSQTTETQELSIDDLRIPNPGEIQTK